MTLSDIVLESHRGTMDKDQFIQILVRKIKIVYHAIIILEQDPIFKELGEGFRKAIEIDDIEPPHA